MGITCDRRSFLKAAGAAAAAGVIPARVLGATAAGDDRTVVAVATSAAHAGKTADVPPGGVREMVGAAVLAATGAGDEKGAWKALFGQGDRVAIKVNMLAGARLSTHPSVVAAIVEGLKSAGVAPANILIFDRLDRELARGGFKIGADASGVRCQGSDNREVGYTSEIITSGAVGSLMSRAVTEFATAIVNVPLLKDHDLSGVSLGMKNFYGVIHNPNKYHDGGCDPYIADLSSCPLIRDRLRLIVIDGLVAQVDGGPAYSEAGSYPYAGVIVGTDPVATDRVGWGEIEATRESMGFKPLKDAGREPKHIFTAAARGLGTADMKRIRVERTSV